MTLLISGTGSPHFEHIPADLIPTLSKPPTIRQLAKESGFSRATVSLALRNSPLISQETRDAILKIAEAHGYRSDPLVASLMARLRVSRARREAEKIAFLTSWSNSRQRQESLETDYSYARFWEGIQSHALRMGYEVEEFSAKELGITLGRLSKMLYTRGIRGVIVAPIARPHGHFTLEWQHFAAVTLTYTVTKPELPRVTHSHYDGMLIALRHLKRLGYRRPGFATEGGQNERVRRMWEGSYLANSTGRAIPPFLPDTLQIEEFEKGRAIQT